MRMLTIPVEEEAEKQTKLLIEAFKKENPNAERYTTN